MVIAPKLNRNSLVLCIAEFFSSFSYFGILSIILLFFIGTLRMPEGEAYSLIGNFVGVSFIVALIAGLISG